MDFESDEMKVFRALHQSLEDSGCDFNLVDSFSLIFRFDSRIKETTLLRIRLNLNYCFCLLCPTKCPFAFPNVHSLILSSHLFFCLPLIFFIMVCLGQSLA